MRYFPCSWKKATIVTIPKPGKELSNPDNYRPISLLPIPGKILEKTLISRFGDYICGPNIVPQHQFGFRRGHSCTLQLLRKVETIRAAWNHHAYVATFYFDIKKAFDTVWHNGLVWKVIQGGTPPAVCRMVSSYLQNRTFCVRVGDCESAEKNIHSGVPQGSVLGPHLFNYFMADMPDIAPCEYFQYADDTAIFSTSIGRKHAIKNLQKAVDIIMKWFDRWKLELNIDKCGAMFFSPTNVRIPCKIRLSGREIPWLVDYKYLGFTFDRFLTGKAHISKIRQRVKILTGALSSLLKRNSILSIDNKLLIYKSVILPIITYGYPVTCIMKGYNLDKICIMQNKILRNIGNYHLHSSSKFCHDHLNIDSVMKRIQALFTDELERLDEHPNELLIRAIDYSLTPLQDFTRTRHFLVYDFPY